MFKRILFSNVPLYYVLILIAAAIAAAVFAIEFYRETIFNYEVRLSGGEPISQELSFGSWPALSNGDFFRQVKERFIAEHATFIEADLDAMQLTFYESGVARKTVPILTKGKEGSWWETPAGLYKVDTKAKNHFSAFAGVYLPWSLPFQGNFFIHGWPYYPDGSAVQSSYSGGCIRLATDDAREIYELVSVGTPVLVFEKDFRVDESAYRVRKPPVSARAYLAADLKNNFVFLENASHESVPVASISKLISSLVATEYIDIEREILVTADSLVPTSRPRLKEGQRITLYNLLFPLLLESSNEAAAAIANALGRNRFVVLMNEKARGLGMASAHFADAAGSSPENVASAEDLFNLAKHLYNNRSFLLRLTAGKILSSVYGPPIFSDLANYNTFDSLPGFIGGKIGLSDAAGETRLSIFEMALDGETRPVAIIVLGSADTERDTELLYHYIQTTYEF